MKEMIGKLAELLKKADENTERKFITDYEDAILDNAEYLIANGVIVPPCKIGDTVYCINTFFQDDPRINECEVDTLHITSGKNRIGQKKPSYALVRNKNMKSLSTRIYFENFGEDVFLTKEEAEQKLKEISDG